MIINIPDGLTFSRTNPEAIVPLRHRVLREGLPLETARWKEDRLDGTCHYAAFPAASPGVPSGPAVCCASFMRSEWRGEPAYHLRGLATDPDYRRRGIGGLLLEWAENAIALGPGIGLLWCNARLAAIPFYLNHGWTLESAAFDIESFGPHRKMAKRLLA